MDEDITLCTVQHARDWEEWQRTGVLRRSEVDFSGRFNAEDNTAILRVEKWHRAYAFMASQMRRRIPGCSVESPIWAWYRPTPPPQEALFHNWLGEGGVAIYFSASRDSALLSDLQPWSGVLRNGYIALSADEYTVFLERKNRSKLDKELRAEVEREEVKSWERIFDLKAIDESELWKHSGIYIQACIEEVRLEQVVSVTKFSNKEH